MTYTPVTWAGDTRITATAFNHFETQYDLACTDFIDSHNHDTRYYTKTAADTTFFWSGFMGSGSGADADYLDGHHYTDIVGESIPLYGIVWWNASSGSLPSGWYVCNGSNGTTDYTDHFICGAGSSYSVKSHLGSNTVTPTGTVTIGTYALTTSDIPSHTHSYDDYWESSPNDNSVGSQYTGFQSSIPDVARTSGSAGSGTAHGHPGSTVTYNSESNVPAYCVLYLVQRRV